MYIIVQSTASAVYCYLLGMKTEQFKYKILTEMIVLINTISLICMKNVALVKVNILKNKKYVRLISLQNNTYFYQIIVAIYLSKKRLKY